MPPDLINNADINLTRSKPLSIVIPTFNRGNILLDTIMMLITLRPSPAEILVIDQTKNYHSVTDKQLRMLEKEDHIRWIHLTEASIPKAMNIGLQYAHHAIVLFIDDDIIPGKHLIGAHWHAHIQKNERVVAGQVLQPGEEVTNDCPKAPFRFSSSRSQYIREIMGGNFSVNRKLALHLGGFDENFIGAAYRFESEFCQRLLASGEKIYFEPKASIRHLQTVTGGIRTHGHHLTTYRPDHSVGEYYFLLQAKKLRRRLLRICFRPLRSMINRFHLKHPWWMPMIFIAELRGFWIALKLSLKGPKLIDNLREVNNYHV